MAARGAAEAWAAGELGPPVGSDGRLAPPPGARVGRGPAAAGAGAAMLEEVFGAAEGADVGGVVPGGVVPGGVAAGGVAAGAGGLALAVGKVGRLAPPLSFAAAVVVPAVGVAADGAVGLLGMAAVDRTGGGLSAPPNPMQPPSAPASSRVAAIPASRCKAGGKRRSATLSGIP